MVMCAGCGTFAVLQDVAWEEVRIQAGLTATLLYLCGDCQRVAHLSERTLVAAVTGYVRERMRFTVADAMARTEVR